MVTPESCAYADACSRLGYRREPAVPICERDMAGTIVRGWGGCPRAAGRKFYICFVSQIAAETDEGRPIISGMAKHCEMTSRAVDRRSRRGYWNWLLAVPLVLLVYPGLYARTTPELFGFPFFYWYQFAVVIATALLTGLVYWLGRFHE